MPKLSAWIREQAPTRSSLVPMSRASNGSVPSPRTQVPCITLQKTRSGDRDVEIEFPDLEGWRSRTPVLVDDIISSGRTMEVVTRHLGELGFAPLICLGVHGLFADDAFERLEAAGASSIACTNTVPHRSSAIDVSDIVAKAVS